MGAQATPPKLGQVSQLVVPERHLPQLASLCLPPRDDTMRHIPDSIRGGPVVADRLFIVPIGVCASAGRTPCAAAAAGSFAAQVTFLDTSGNASSQSLGAGGTLVWRPDPWT